MIDYSHKIKVVSIYLDDKWYVKTFKRVKYFFLKGESMLLINVYKI